MTRIKGKLVKPYFYCNSCDNLKHIDNEAEIELPEVDMSKRCVGDKVWIEYPLIRDRYGVLVPAVNTTYAAYIAHFPKEEQKAELPEGAYHIISHEIQKVIIAINQLNGVVAELKEGKK